MTTLPIWAVVAVTVGTPLSAFVGVVLGLWLSRAGASQLEIWRRREETMRLLRWAAEQATSPDIAKARMGVAALDALSTSELLQDADRQLVSAVMAALIQETVRFLAANEDKAVTMRVQDGG